MKLLNTLVLRNILIMLMLLLSTKYYAAAQIAGATTLIEQSKLSAIQHFKQALNENALIYSGNEYIEYVPIESLNQILKGTPFFIKDSIIEGQINYDGIMYSLPLKFHLIEQKLIIKHPVAQTLIALTNDQVHFFNIGSHFFYKTPIQLSNLFKTDKVYAEQLLAGHFELWVIYDKTIKYSKKAEDQSASFISYNNYAVKKNGVWRKMKSEKDLYDFCGDKKELIKQYVNQSGVDLNKDFETSLLQVLKYYDSISN